ncbi:Protein of unknown function [Gryllus bimaculatus]|nr:Protein of unknown function [Gryllus bimaculatus]
MHERSILLTMAILLIQSTVDASDEAPSPVDHGEVLLVCNCICEINATSLQLLFCPPWRMTSPTSTATRLSPTSDFAILPRPVYKFVGCESADTWHNANETCAKDGAYLAVPHSMIQLSEEPQTYSHPGMAFISRIIRFECDLCGLLLPRKQEM